MSTLPADKAVQAEDDYTARQYSDVREVEVLPSQHTLSAVHTPGIKCRSVSNQVT